MSATPRRGGRCRRCRPLICPSVMPFTLSSVTPFAAHNARRLHANSLHGGGCRSVDYVTLAVDVWLFMVLPTVYALTKSVLPISQGTTRLCE